MGTTCPSALCLKIRRPYLIMCMFVIFINSSFRMYNVATQQKFTLTSYYVSTAVNEKSRISRAA